ncbi:unnamed protein product [Urochloa decumbens]|uniref:Protein FAR1-RELATED SEQUENCE n=1 Tax=Urochloa decumbens TaxID=240449 RepID=A0ABC9D895_9POAL
MSLVTHWEVVLDLNTIPEHDGAESVLGEVPTQVAANSVHSGVGTAVVSGSYGHGNVLIQAESGGVTVPTAETNFSADDVEDGIEVISTPQEPCVGMVFATADAAKKYYNSYARHAGFSIRIDSSRESKKTEEKTRYIYVCQRAGVNKKEKVATDGPITEKKIVRERRRDYVERTRCPARMIVRRTPHGQWEIMADLYGGIDNCPYTEGDVKNLRVEYRAEYKCKDMKKTLDYFSELQKDDPDFYYSYTLDEEDRVENLFWVDSAARKSYELYGDCISFDATYLTNAYNMPFAPFIGIDRNGITIQLGCGFLRNEKTESYVWLFSEFKNAMGGKDPLNIITDQDLAMKAAIALVFETSTHRNCRWHIVENDRKSCEFESKWQAMLDKHEINGDQRFEHLYEMRKSWVPAYFMQRFFPFLQTIARSEGFNAVLKRYVNLKDSIYNFVQQYKKIQQRIFSKQDLQEAVTVTKVPHYLTGHPMERQMKEVYTRKLFNVFQQELQLSSSYYVVRVEGDSLLDVVPYRSCPEELYGPRTFRVTAAKSDGLWSAEILADDGIEVLGESLQAPEISSSRKHIVRYNRICTSFNKIIVPHMGDDEGYSIVSKHVAAMQAELNELRKRKASNVSPGPRSGQVGQPSGGALPNNSKKPRKKAST